MDNWEYTCIQSPCEALKSIRNFLRIKIKDLDVGATLKDEGINLNFFGFEDIVRIRFSKTSKGSRVCVTVPDSLRDKTSTLLARLVEKRILRPADKMPTSASAFEQKTFKNAFDVLKTRLSDPNFTKHIEITPEALKYAEKCLYEHDGKLDKALTKLAQFAVKRAEKRIAQKHLIALAEKSGLSNLYRPMVSDTVVRVHGDHYRLDYNGNKTLFDEHITLGSGLPKKCMSIHFIWDESRSILVIGYFGRHLPTSSDK